MYFESDVNPSPERIFAYRRTQCKVNSWRLDDGGDPIVVDVKTFKIRDDSWNSFPGRLPLVCPQNEVSGPEFRLD